MVCIVSFGVRRHEEKNIFFKYWPKYERVALLLFFLLYISRHFFFPSSDGSRLSVTRSLWTRCSGQYQNQPEATTWYCLKWMQWSGFVQHCEQIRCRFATDQRKRISFQHGLNVKQHVDVGVVAKAGVSSLEVSTLPKQRYLVWTSLVEKQHICVAFLAKKRYLVWSSSVEKQHICVDFLAKNKEYLRGLLPQNDVVATSLYLPCELLFPLQLLCLLPTHLAKTCCRRCICLKA